MDKIVPCLWFDANAEEAVDFYLGIFPNSRILETTYYTESDHPAHEGRAGSVLTIEFELNGRTYTALNGGPQFQFTEAVSFQVMCDNQEEIDYYWEKLSAGGASEAQMCGWLKDKFGVSWQIVPRELLALISQQDPAANSRVMKALLTMIKLDLAALKTGAVG